MDTGGHSRTRRTIRWRQRTSGPARTGGAARESWGDRTQDRGRESDTYRYSRTRRTNNWRKRTVGPARTEGAARET